MPRFYIPPDSIHAQKFFLSGSEAHHALRVLRKKVGDVIYIFDGKDRSYRGRIDSIQGDQVSGTIVEDLPPSSLPVEIVLYQALTRGAKWDWLLEKACEIGVARVVPVLSRRCTARLDPGTAKTKVDRWNRIALAASKQCGRSLTMAVEAPRELAIAFSIRDKDHLSLIPWEKENEKTIAQACKGFQGSHVNLFIGPEGGWDPQEIEIALQTGIIPVRLGPTLLRTETAGLVAATLTLCEFSVY